MYEMFKSSLTVIKRSLWVIFVSQGTKILFQSLCTSVMFVVVSELQGSGTELQSPRDWAKGNQRLLKLLNGEVLDGLSHPTSRLSEDGDPTGQSNGDEDDGLEAMAIGGVPSSSQELSTSMSSTLDRQRSPELPTAAMQGRTESGFTSTMLANRHFPFPQGIQKSQTNETILLKFDYVTNRPDFWNLNAPRLLLVAQCILFR